MPVNISCVIEWSSIGVEKRYTDTVSNPSFTAGQLCALMHIFWRRQWHPTPVLLPGKSHGRRSLVGCSPWGREELDTTE